MGHLHTDADTWMLQFSAFPEPQRELPAAGLHWERTHGFGKVPHAAK